MRKSQYQKIVAHHEAGHAVVARLLGVGIAEAFGRGRKQVGSDAGSVNTESASFRAKGTPYYREAIRIDLMVALAGMVAQIIYRAQYTKGLDYIEEWDSDRENATVLAVKYYVASGDGTIDLPPGTPIPLEQAQTLFDSTTVEVEKMLRDNWAKVERVAKLFLRYGNNKIDPVEIDAAMAQTSSENSAA